MASTYERGEDLEYPRGFVYGRTGNPTRNLLESTLAAAEGGTEAASFATGMAGEGAAAAAAAAATPARARTSPTYADRRPAPALATHPDAPDSIKRDIPGVAKGPRASARRRIPRHPHGAATSL